MNEEIKAKWVAALRGGEYEQGRGGLRKENEYCCLGVLCDIHRVEVGGQWRVLDEPFHEFDDYSPDGAVWEDDVLPNLVAEWAALPNSPSIQSATLAGLNDGTMSAEGTPELRPHSFIEIAVLIEKHL